MKSRKEMRKPERDVFAGTDEFKKTHKLKPVKKEKNPKRAFFDEIDDLEDVDLNNLGDELDDEELYDDEEDDY